MSNRHLTNPTQWEAKHLKNAQLAANQVWERQYNKMLALGHDPADARELATMDTEATNSTEDSIVGWVSEQLHALRTDNIEPTQVKEAPLCEDPVDPLN